MRSLRIMAWAFGLAVLLASGRWAYAAEPENLISNPGFEEVDKTTGQLSDWLVEIWSEGEFKTAKTALEVSDDARTGKRAMKVRWLEGSKNILCKPTLTASVTGRQKLRLTFYCKGPGAVAAYASVITNNAEKKELQYLHSERVKPDGEWAPVNFDFETAADTARFSIWLRVNGDGIIFDDVSLVRLNP